MSSVWHVECKDCISNENGMCKRLKKETPINVCVSGVFKSDEIRHEVEAKEFVKQYQQYILVKRKFEELEKYIIKKRDWHLMNLLYAGIDNIIDDICVCEQLDGLSFRDNTEE